MLDLGVGFVPYNNMTDYSFILFHQVSSSFIFCRRKTTWLHWCETGVILFAAAIQKILSYYDTVKDAQRRSRLTAADGLTPR